MPFVSPFASQLRMVAPHILHVQQSVNPRIIVIKVKNIGFDIYISILGFYGYIGYIGTWILRTYWIHQRYIGGYFYINIDISEINKNILKLMKILYKSVKMTLIMKYTH